ncbi:MAG: UDP-N-acetylenolpyruvoylglucosamine reductase [Pedosphaera sp. Tous-C6FEB]|nr:MAG: UDP-N-acetylenolpyruvoylglucosamine reductase [Pedosphaera sp. Tous-C6FEB]
MTALVPEPVTPAANLAEKLGALLSPATVLRRNEPLAKRTTLRVGGPAEVFVEPANEVELSVVLRFCHANDVPFFVLGRGSNLLIRDGGIRGVVIHLGTPGFAQIELEAGQLRCGAGAKLRDIALTAKRHGLGGLEFFEGIPGNLGGALRMNAGAMNGWTFDRVESLRFMDYHGQAHQRAASEVPTTYRSCPLLKTAIALGATLHGTATPPDQIEARLVECQKKRWTSQPKEPSAGCMFKNPATIPAGKLVEELGLKGTRVGGAMVSPVHGNFIVNDQGATARDVLALLDLVRRTARSERGIELETEVEIIGED